MLIVVNIDALRYDYADEPSLFLHRIACEGLKGRLVPTFGFEPDAAYLAGLYPDDADGGAQFWFDPPNSPFRTLPLPSVLNRLPKLPRRALRRTLKDLARRWSSSPTLSCA